MKRFAFIVVVLALASFASSLSGVSPGSYEVDYMDGLDEEFIFKFIFDTDIEYEIYASGLLSDSVILDKDTIVGSQSVSARLLLGSIDEVRPGVNKIRIGARPVSLGDTAGVGLQSDVGGIIKVFVPYPGKYAEASVFSPNGNVGEKINLSILISSLGVESVRVKPSIQVFFEGEKVEDIEFREVRLDHKEQVEYSGLLDTKGYLPGEYTAIGVLEYEETFSQSNSRFRLGEYSIEITNYTSKITSGGPAKFEVEVTSNWNGVIEGIYSKVSLDSKDSPSFNTLTTSISSFEKKNLIGYLDTDEISEDSLSGEIVLYYGNESTRKDIFVYVEHSFDYLNLLFILIIIILVILLLIRVYVFVLRYKKIKRS